MLLAIDIGNSNIVFGVFDKSKLINHWRIETAKDKSEDFYRQKLSEKNIARVDNVIIGSVVPELDTIFDHISSHLFKTKPQFVSTMLDTGITNLTNTPSELGADRLADIVAAISLYPGPRIVVDLGTASKFEAISEKNEYLGGAIGPGIGVSFTSLIHAASKLHDMKLSSPKKVVGGFTTEEHLNSGFVNGFAGLIDGMVLRIQEELHWDNPHIVMTGGFTELVSQHLKTKATIHKNLTIEGLRTLWERNQKIRKVSHG